MNKRPNFRYNDGNPIPIGWRILKDGEITQKYVDYIVTEAGVREPEQIFSWCNRSVFDLKYEYGNHNTFIRKINNLDRSETNLKYAKWERA